MEKSRCHGSFSSHLSDENEAAASQVLAEISKKPHVIKLREVLGAEGQLHLVGGLVRDALSGVAVADIDIACKHPPQKTKERLSTNAIKVVDTGIQHGTVTAVFPEGSIEITSFRKPGARTVFECSESIEADLGGRDFTINAVAYSIDAGTFIDPYSGIADLKARRLRAVQNARERFMEDPHRLLRMVRFGPAQGRIIDPITQNAAIELKSSLKHVSVERIRVELDKILLSAHPKSAFRFIRDAGFLELLLPELLPSVGFDQNEFHTEDVYEHTLSVVEGAISDRLVRWAALFHDAGKPRSLSVGDDGRRHFYNHEVFSAELATSAMERLKFSRDDVDTIRQLVALHMRPIECGPTGVRRLIRELEERFERWRELKKADKTPTMDRGDFEEKLSKFDSLVTDEKNRLIGSPFDALALDGNDLIELGMKPGPKIGQVLRALLEIITENPELNVKDVLRERAKKLIEAL